MGLTTPKYALPPSGPIGGLKKQKNGEQQAWRALAADWHAKAGLLTIAPLHRGTNAWIVLCVELGAKAARLVRETSK
jgi:hypothetical protein